MPCLQGGVYTDRYQLTKTVCNYHSLDLLLKNFFSQMVVNAVYPPRKWHLKNSLFNNAKFFHLQKAYNRMLM